MFLPFDREPVRGGIRREGGREGTSGKGGVAVAAEAKRHSCCDLRVGDGGGCGCGGAICSQLFSGC